MVERAGIEWVDWREGVSIVLGFLCRLLKMLLHRLIMSEQMKK